MALVTSVFRVVCHAGLTELGGIAEPGGLTGSVTGGTFKVGSPVQPNVVRVLSNPDYHLQTISHSNRSRLTSLGSGFAVLRRHQQGAWSRLQFGIPAPVPDL